MSEPHTIPIREISFEFFVKKLLKSIAVFEINPYKQIWMTNRLALEGQSVIHYNGGSISKFIEKDINKKIKITKDSFLIQRREWKYEEDEEAECDYEGYKPMKKVGEPFLVSREIQLLGVILNK
jgi:hypothetical protein